MVCGGQNIQNKMTTIYFDFETGGTQLDHPSIQLAAIAVDDKTGNELSSFEQKIAFDPAQCDPEALKVNGWTKEAWKNAATPEATKLEFIRFLEPHKCVKMTSKKTGNPYYVAKGAGYNAASFDMPRLQALFGKEFLPVSYLVRDVLQLAIFHFDVMGNAPENFKLSTVCKHFGIDTEGAHDALADVRMTAALFHRLKLDAWPFPP